MTNASTWTDVSMRYVYPGKVIYHDTYFEIKRIIGEVFEVQSPCLDGIFDVMENE